MILPFKQVDVFTRIPFRGNPVAVVLDGRDLSDDQMLAIARWTNLSETTFVLPSEVADYGLRIFTPGGELPFAGHPTIGSAHAVIEAGLVTPRGGRLTQACGIGVVPLEVTEWGVRATVPTPRVTNAGVAPGELSRALGGTPVADPLVFDTGAVWLVARVDTPGVLERVVIDAPAIANWSVRLGTSGLTLYAVGADASVHVRSFAPAKGILEDPVCGSGNLCVAAHLKHTGGLALTGLRYEARQGRCLARDGRVEVTVGDETISLGGSAVTVIDGTLRALTPALPG